MKKVSILTILLFVITFININCQKEGPAGEQGPPGPAGPTGAAGPTGPAGTANVMYSNWFTPTQNGGWLDTVINGVASQKKFNKAASGISLSILNTGLVLAYVKLNPDGAGGTTSSIRQLPYANPGSATENVTINYLGSITYAVISTSSPGVAVAAQSSALEFRYLIIPGAVVSGRSIDQITDKFVEINGKVYTESQLRTIPYEQVCSLLNIPE